MNSLEKISLDKGKQMQYLNNLLTNIHTPNIISFHTAMAVMQSGRNVKKMWKYSDYDFIVENVVNVFKIQKSELYKKIRHREIVFPRQVCMYFAFHFLDISYKSIGDHFGLDHATAMHAKNKVEDLIKYNGGNTDVLRVGKVEDRLIVNGMNKVNRIKYVRN